MNSGPRLNPYCRDFRYPNAGAAPGPTTGRSSKGSCGFCGPEPRGKICPNGTPAGPPAGVGFATGKNRMSGWISGELSWPNWTNAASWTGVSASSTAVLPRRKKGRMRGKNQERQGNEVDGGGRRPRCSSGKPPGLGVPVGNHARRENAPDDSRSASGTGSPQTQAPTIGCRSGLRWGSFAKVVGPTGHRTDLSTPQESTEKADAGWSTVAEVQATLESRTDLCLVRQQPPTGRAIRSKHPDLSCVLPCRLSGLSPQEVMKWLLGSLCMAAKKSFAKGIFTPCRLWL